MTLPFRRMCFYLSLRSPRTKAPDDRVSPAHSLAHVPLQVDWGSCVSFHRPAPLTVVSSSHSPKDSITRRCFPLGACNSDQSTSATGALTTIDPIKGSLSSFIVENRLSNRLPERCEVVQVQALIRYVSAPS